MNKKCIIILLIVFSIISSSFVQVFASSIKDLEEEQKKVDTKMNDIEKEVKVLGNKTKEVEKEIGLLDKEIGDASVELREVEEQLEKLNEDIDIITKELENAEEKLNSQDELFKKRVRVMYTSGNTGYFELLLSSKNIKDFLSKQMMMEKIVEHDKDLIKSIKEQKNIIEEKKTKLEAQRVSINTAKKELSKKRDRLNLATREKESMMGRLQLDIKAFEKEYDKLTQQAKDLEKEIFMLQTKDTTYDGGVMSWPSPGYTRVTSVYGYRIHPIFKVKKFHTGVDIGVPMGGNIIAVADGDVIQSGLLGGYGYTVMIDHGGGIVTLYAHNSSLLKNKGDKVKRGEVIAKAGSTGNSTGPHLHFEVRKDGKYEDPMPWLSKN